MLLVVILALLLIAIATAAVTIFMSGEDIAGLDLVKMGRDEIPSIKAVVGKRDVQSSSATDSGGVMTTTLVYQTKVANQSADDISAYIKHLTDRHGFISLADMAPSEVYTNGYTVQLAKESLDSGKIIVCTMDFANAGYTLVYRKGVGTITIQQTTDPVVTIEQPTQAPTLLPTQPTTPAVTQATTASPTQPTTAASTQAPTLAIIPPTSPTTGSGTVAPTQPASSGATTHNISSSEPWLGLWRSETLEDIEVYNITNDGKFWMYYLAKSSGLEMTVTGNYTHKDGSISVTNAVIDGQSAVNDFTLTFESLGASADFDGYMFDRVPSEYVQAVLANPASPYPPSSGTATVQIPPPATVPIATQPTAAVTSQPATSPTTPTSTAPQVALQTPSVVAAAGWTRMDYDDGFELDSSDPNKDTATMTVVAYEFNNEDEAGAIVYVAFDLLRDRFADNPNVGEHAFEEIMVTDINGHLAQSYKVTYTYHYDAGTQIIDVFYTQWDIFIQKGPFVYHICCNASQEQWDLVMIDYLSMLGTFTLR